MADLTCTYMGIELKNPIIAGASKLTMNIDSIKAIEAAGASAIVCASLFEEQIELEQMQHEEQFSAHDGIAAEFTSVLPEVEHAGPREHLMWVRKTKEAVDIPVFASLNAVTKDAWVEYAQQLAGTGIDGLELNFYYTPSDLGKSGAEVEAEQVEMLKAVKAAVSIPITVKLSNFYSNPLNVIKQMDGVGVDAFILFNRFYESEIDVATERHSKQFKLSPAGSNGTSNRFIGLLSGEVNAGLVANTAVLTGTDVVKAVLAGAHAVQVVSTLYANEISYVGTMLKDLEAWMDEKGYASLADFRGKLSRQNTTDPYVYRRAQYVDLILNSNKLLG